MFQFLKEPKKEGFPGALQTFSSHLVFSVMHIVLALLVTLNTFHPARKNLSKYSYFVAILIKKMCRVSARKLSI
jgi:hypothetical protein